MNINNLRPAREFAQNFGVKAVIYGPPGSAKTPLINTAPRPVLLACEPGLLSMKTSNVPTWLGYDAKNVDAFFSWFFNSTETKNFDTLAVDSVSQMAEIYLQDAQKTNKHGMAAYGEMARNVMEHMRRLYFFPQKHTYLIAKEQVLDDNGVKVRRPYYPGQQLPTDIPHLYDGIFRLSKSFIPGMVGETLAFRCVGTTDIIARDRTGNLNEFEEPNFAKLVAKAMA